MRQFRLADEFPAVVVPGPAGVCELRDTNVADFHEIIVPFLRREGRRRVGVGHETTGRDTEFFGRVVKRCMGKFPCE